MTNKEILDIITKTFKTVDELGFDKANEYYTNTYQYQSMTECTVIASAMSIIKTVKELSKK